MSFQAYLDNAEKKSGRTPQEIVDLAHAQDFDADTHRDESTTLRLDGLAAR